MQMLGAVNYRDYRVSPVLILTGARLAEYYRLMVSAHESYMLSHEVAELFGVTTQTIYNWLRKGKIPEPKRHAITQYRLWTPQDVQRIRQFVAEEKNR